MTATASWLRRQRTALGLTQAELAAEIGVDLRTYARWEASGPPSPKMARALIELLFRRRGMAVDRAAEEQ